MNKVKNYIIKQVAKNALTQSEAKEMLMELKTKPEIHDIAIIGMDCRYPYAENTNEYWNNLKNGTNCIREVPAGRLNDFKNIISLFGGANRSEDISPDIFNLSGYLTEVDRFDAGFFRIPPGEAIYMDPLQRVFLETSYNAVEDAGYGGQMIYGTNTGVFLGYDFTNETTYKHTTEPNQMHLTGSWTGIMSTRMSYIYNLGGPGMVIDTACSSSLSAIHEACQALRHNECDMAIAGGICIFQRLGYRNSEGGLNMIESDDYTIRTFDKNANGTVWGEGVGVILLKPLNKAIHDRDNIHAVIKGSAINNDGASNGITAPNSEAQANVIQKAWSNSGIDPETISYIETHGTGTKLGDPVEIKGITSAFKKYTEKSQFCAIGSVKTNIGHTVGASGIASVLKVVLSMKNKILPPSLNFNEPNPYINFCSSPVYVNDRLNVWEKGSSPRRAGASGYGFSGTNCHIVLEEAPDIINENAREPLDLYIFAISARSEGILKELIKKYAVIVKDEQDMNLEDICYTANTGRGHYNYRLAVVAKDYNNFKNKILSISDTTLELISGKDIFYGHYKIIPENKELREKGDLTEKEVRYLSKYASDIISQSFHQQEIDRDKLLEIAGVYVKGAVIEWEDLYRGRNLRRLSLPVYPLERIRVWANPLIIPANTAVIRQNGTKYNHPLIDSLVVDSIHSAIYSTNFEPSRHWVLSDHKIMKNCVVPGTTYLEIAREMGCNFYKDSILELRDVLFLAPLVIAEGGNSEVQMVLKKEKDRLDFIIAGKNTGNEQNPWIVHAEGKIFKGSGEKEVIDIESIKSKCNEGEIVFENDNTSNLNQTITFGLRWRNMVRMYCGQNELLLELKLPDGAKDDIGRYGLHPALMDNAVNIASQSAGEGLYLPLSYKRLVLYDTMPDRFYSYVRRHDNTAANMETVTFDITLIDMEGNIFAQINNYDVKKVREVKTLFKNIKKQNDIAGKTPDHASAGKEITIKGASSENLTGTRLKLANIWANVLGLDEIDIFEDFYDLGGDSMLAGQLLKELDSEYPGLFTISDIFSYPSVSLLAEYINTGAEQGIPSDEPENDAEGVDNEKLRELLDGLEKGETSVEDGMDMLF